MFCKGRTSKLIFSQTKQELIDEIIPYEQQLLIELAINSSDFW
jgi:hypothetical protein